MSLEQWRGLLADNTRRTRYEEYLKEQQDKVGAFLEQHLPSGETGSGSDGPLNGIPFGVKDNIAVDGFGLTCGSRMLESYRSPYDATVIQKLKAAGALPIAKCNLDEFGMGSSTDNSALGQTNNPWDLSRVAGGSSGGSAAAVACGMVPFALGSDTGGSVRQPAAFCGVYGLKPTYGAISRYGLVAYASSLEVVGILAEDVGTLRAVFESVRGKDEADQSGLACPDSNAPNPESTRIGIIDSLEGLAPGVEELYKETISNLERSGYQLVKIEMPALEHAVASYYTIAMAEASANLARYTGIRYGFRPDDARNMEQMVRDARSLGFGHEVKLRILLGTYVLRSGFQDQYYGKAQKIRTLIAADFNKAFTGCDLVLMPVFPTQAFARGDVGLDPFAQKLADKFTVPANLAGIPALSVPVGVRDGLPVGVQFLGPHFAEERIFRAAERLAKENGTADGIPRPEGYRSI